MKNADEEFWERIEQSLDRLYEARTKNLQNFYQRGWSAGFHHHRCRWPQSAVYMRGYAQGRFHRNQKNAKKESNKKV